MEKAEKDLQLLSILLKLLPASGADLLGPNLPSLLFGDCTLLGLPVCVLLGPDLHLSPFFHLSPCQLCELQFSFLGHLYVM